MNVGNTDRIIRVIIGIIAVVISIFISIFWLQVVLWIAAAIMLITATAGFCPLYKLLHLNTKKKT
jgi:hypothetical protein